MKKLLLLTIFSIIITAISAQTFTTIDTGLASCHDPAASWVDLDNDGDLDIFIAGEDTSNLINFHVYRNDGNDVFTEFYPSIDGVTFAASAFGDYNKDGLADLALCGFDGNNAITKVYTNDGGFQFTDIGAGLTGVQEGSLAWADYNHDGYFDLLVAGVNNSGDPVSILYMNEAGNGFADAGQSIEGLYKSSLAWYDIDGDQDMDFAICGMNDADEAKTYVYLNEDGVFTDMEAGLDGMWGGMLDWGDFNNDGYADLIISGTDDSDTSHVRLYKSNSGTSFSALTGPFTAASDGSSFWGDFDNDGLLDILIAGGTRSTVSPLPPPDDPIMNLYINQGNDTFLEEFIDKGIPYNNHIVCGDFDNDSDLDLLLAGAFINPISGGEDHVKIFRNETNNQNNPPSAPTGLTEDITGNDLNFSWLASSDDSTPVDGLNYNLRIGSQPDNMDILSALADLNDGYRRIPDNGNAGQNTAMSVSGLPFGEYYASVQAIDHSFAGSQFSDDLLVSYMPTAYFTLADSSCVEDLEMITYTGNASANATYNWNFDNAVVLSGSGQGPYVVKWLEPGIKTVTLTVVENGYSSDPYSRDIVVVDHVVSAGAVTGETEFCQGTDSTEYIVSPINGAVYYQWVLDPSEAGIVVGSGLVGVVAWDPGFSGTVFMSVSGANYCGAGPSSNMLEITVDPIPGKPGAPEGPANLCLDQPNTEYTSSGAVHGLSYTWYLFPEEAGVITGNGLQAAVDWDDSFTGVAGIYLISENTCGTGPYSDTLNIVVQEPPQAYAGEDQEITYQSLTQLTGTASGGSGSYSYYWLPDDLLEDPTVADPLTVSLELTVQFTLIVTDELTACEATDDIIVNVIGGPLSVDATADPNEVCPGGETQLLALASGGTGNRTYSWTSNPSGFTSDIADPVASPVETTTYYIEVNDGSEQAYDSVLVMVNPLPGSPVEMFGPETVCAGDEQVLYEITAVANATHYYWNLPDGVFGNSDSTSILVSFANPFINAGGSISVWAMNECGQSDLSASITPEVETRPERPQNIAGADSLCTTTDTLVGYMLEDAVPLATAYEWQVLPEEAGYISGDGLEAIMHWSQNWEGDAAIIVRAFNDCGYSDWSDPYTVSAFSCVGIQEHANEKLEILVFPNPASEVLSVGCWVLGDYQDLKLNIFDMFGRKVIESDIEGHDIVHVNVSDLQEGMYIINIYTAGQLLGQSKFIIGR